MTSLRLSTSCSIFFSYTSPLPTVLTRCMVGFTATGASSLISVLMLHWYRSAAAISLRQRCTCTSSRMSSLDSGFDRKLRLTRTRRLLFDRDFVLAEELHELLAQTEGLQVQLPSRQVQRVNHQGNCVVAQIDLVSTLCRYQLRRAKRTHERRGVPPNYITIHVGLNE